MLRGLNEARTPLLVAALITGGAVVIDPVSGPIINETRQFFSTANSGQTELLPNTTYISPALPRFDERRADGSLQIGTADCTATVLVSTTDTLLTQDPKDPTVVYQARESDGVVTISSKNEKG